MVRAGGRLRVHERETSDAPVLGSDIVLHQIHQRSVEETRNHEKAEKTRKEHRSRVKRMCAWWKTHYPNYYEVGVRALSEAECADQTKHFYTNTHDIIYTGLNVQFVLAFLSDVKEKENGKIAGFSHIRKFHDAIIYGSSSANQPLPPLYYIEIDKFLAAFKKETAQARKLGNTDEKEADPIPWSLYQLICGWAVSEGNILVWVWTTLQWSCMARSINIESLSFHNITLGEDSIKIKYDSTKADKEGKKCSPKNIYSNPLDPLACVTTALGIWLCLRVASYAASEVIFQNSPQDKERSASKRYCEQVAAIFSRYVDRVRVYLRPGHANVHGLRKGSGTHVTAATTCPPPIASIADRGEWSMGKVFDVYWTWAEPGDTYLGRCLSGLDPNTEDFALLPPHWIMEDPMSNEYVKTAMNMMYSTILQRWSSTDRDPTGLLLRCLASVVHHSDWILRKTAEFPGHPFTKIPIISYPILLNDLKPLVTIEKTSTMQSATGIPPHIEAAAKTRKLLEMCTETLQAVRNQATQIRDAVFEAFETRAEENGQVTGERLKSILDDFKTSIMTDIGDRIDELKQNGYGASEQNLPPQPDLEAAPHGPGHVLYPPFIYTDPTGQQKFWDVPEDFRFPLNTDRKTGWRLWLNGLPNNQVLLEDGTTKCHPIAPFSKFNTSRLPNAVKQAFRLHWIPVFSLMGSAPGLDLPARRPPTGYTGEDLDAAFTITTAHLKSRASYIWNDRKKRTATWSVSTWAKHLRYSSIEKNGTASDKAALPEPTRYNTPREGDKRTRQRSNLETPRVNRRRVTAQDMNPPAPPAPPAPPQPPVPPPPAPPAPLEQEENPAQPTEGREQQARTTTRQPTNSGDADAAFARLFHVDDAVTPSTARAQESAVVANSITAHALKEEERRLRLVQARTAGVSGDEDGNSMHVSHVEGEHAGSVRDFADLVRENI
jgi:hypothetical protein